MVSGRLVISSRNSVPPAAASKQPVRMRSAPVNDPRSWPNNSLSIRLGGKRSAVDRNEWGGRPAGSTDEWSWQQVPYPTPVSPVTMTVKSVGATRWTSSMIRRIGWLGAHGFEQARGRRNQRS